MSSKLTFFDTDSVGSGSNIKSAGNTGHISLQENAYCCIGLCVQNNSPDYRGDVWPKQV
jgi:hypothetical protein